MSSKCLTFCSCLFPLLARIAESPYREMFLARIAEIILRNYTVLARLGNIISFSCQSNLPFCGDDEEEIRPKPYRGLPQASNGINSCKHEMQRSRHRGSSAEGRILESTQVNKRFEFMNKLRVLFGFRSRDSQNLNACSLFAVNSRC